MRGDAVEILGIVTYQDLEGGFYAIDGLDGTKYDPIHLPESYRKDGLKVRIRAQPRPELMSIRMYGDIIEIIDIEAQ